MGPGRHRRLPGDCDRRRGARRRGHAEARRGALSGASASDPIRHNARVTSYVVLLRGVNVGGRARVSMAALRETCASVGCEDVATYIQSGNVVLRSALGADALRDR
ncbi:MAG TPA: DUF1697 domain-containing protein, partial [Candidatus Limnocylindria bacterium]|nr:DUF1697 domain-containing protein [Candidatus Limnocylindria bacterium]